MKKNNTKVKETLAEMQELSNYMKRLNEGIVFDDAAPEMGAEGEVPEVSPENDMHSEGGESEEEKAMHAQEIVRHEPIIAKIRETAIEGIKKYSDNPTSVLYTFFKKVFLDADKTLTGGDNK